MNEEMIEQFQTIQKASFAGIVVHEDGVIREVNDRISRICGYEPDELIGMDCLRLIAPQSRDFAGKKIFSDAYTIHGLMGIKKDGGAFPLKIEGKTLSSDGRVMQIMEWYPLEEEKPNFAEVWDQSEAMKFFVENISDAVTFLDADFKIRFVNAAFERNSHGYRRQEVVGRPIFDFLDQASVEKIRQTNRMRLAAEAAGVLTGPVRYEVLARRKSGDAYYRAEAIVNPSRDAQMKLSGYSCIIRDLDRDGRYRRQKISDDETLGKERKMVRVGRIAGVVAHDLNNVLTGIQGYSELLALEAGVSQELTHQVKNIIHSTERAASIVQDLSALCRTERQPAKMILLNDLVTVCLNNPHFRKASQAYADVDLHVDLESGLPFISGFAPHLEKSVMHLLILALDAAAKSERKKVCVDTRSLYLGRPTHEDATMPEGEYAVLSVYDTGGSIAAHDMAHVFDPFYAKKVLRRGLTGLELIVVRQTLEDCGGYIDVYSDEHFGTTFTAYFPVYSDKAQPAGPSEAGRLL